MSYIAKLKVIVLQIKILNFDMSNVNYILRPSKIRCKY